MENKNWFIHVEWVVVLITILGGFYTIDAKIERQSSRVDMVMQECTSRNDRLYEMFIQLIKENNSSRKEAVAKEIEFDHRLQDQAKTMAMISEKVMQWRNESKPKGF
jgi:hypothetical protein